MPTHLFVDESLRGPYVLVAGVVEADDLARVRTLLRGLRLRGERSVHFQAERDSRRRLILSRLVDAGLVCRVYTGKGKAESVRQACVTALIEDACKEGAQRLVFESRGQALDKLDRHNIARTLTRISADGQSGGATIGRPGPTYLHLRPYEEPALWLPDAVAWSYGASGDWRARITPLVAATLEVGHVE